MPCVLTGNMFLGSASFSFSMRRKESRLHCLLSWCTDAEDMLGSQGRGLLSQNPHLERQALGSGGSSRDLWPEMAEIRDVDGLSMCCCFLLSLVTMLPFPRASRNHTRRKQL